jgi:hypothetical protein
MTEMVLAREERLVLWDGLLMGSGGGALVSVLWLLSCYNKPLTCLQPFKGTVSRDFLHQDFFIFPEASKISSGSFRIFSKIRGDIRKSRWTTGINDTGGKFATRDDTGGKFDFSINCTGGKFATGAP